MQQSDRVAFLAATELLARVPRPGLEAIARDMLIRQVDTGVVLFEEGDPGDEAYLVVDGDVALVAGGVEIACRGAGGTPQSRSAFCAPSPPSCAARSTRVST